MLDSLHSLPLHNALYSLQSSRGDIRSTLQWKDRHLVIGLCHCWTLPGLAAVPWGLWIRSGKNFFLLFFFSFLAQCATDRRQRTYCLHQVRTDRPIIAFSSHSHPFFISRATFFQTPQATLPFPVSHFCHLYHSLTSLFWVVFYNDVSHMKLYSM